MNKKITIGLVLSAALLLAGCAGQGNIGQVENKNGNPATENKSEKIPENSVLNQQSEKGPDQIVGEYYTSIIAFLNKKISKDNSLSSDFVTQKIVNSYNKVKNVPANPFLCAQDYPDDASKLAVTLIKKDDFSVKYNVVVFTNWPPISVSLIKQEGVWRINEIICSNGNKL